MFSLRNSHFVPKHEGFFAIRYLCASFVHSWTFIAFCTCSLHYLEVHVCWDRAFKILHCKTVEFDRSQW